MAKEPIFLTGKGLERIKEELRYLKEEKRQELSEYMGKAIEDGRLARECRVRRGAAATKC